MAWVDLVAQMYKESSVEARVSAGARWNSWWEGSQYLDGSGDAVILGGCSDRVMYWSPNTTGSGGRVVKNMYYFGRRWNSDAYAIYTRDMDDNFNLVGRRVRVRARWEGGDPAEADITGTGMAGFVFTHTSGGSMSVDTTIANFSDYSAWGDADIVEGDWSPWHEHLITADDVVSSNYYVFEGLGLVPGYTTSSTIPRDYFVMEWQVWIPDPPPRGSRVYELDRGWSFDGAYIPHFLELNWYFGEDPFTDKTIQKVRIHGLSKGLANVSLAVAGMQTEYDSDYTEGQHIPLPRNAAHITTEYFPVTNYVDSSNWGVSMQMKFEGSNTDLTKPEPSHVLQVLALQSSPQGNGKRIN